MLRIGMRAVRTGADPVSRRHPAFGMTHGGGAEVAKIRSRGRIVKKKIVIIVFVLLFAGAGVFVYIGQNTKKTNDLFYSGTIETTQAKLSFQAPGRVAEVKVQEGQSVKKNQVIALLDRAEFASRYEQAKANLDRAVKTKQQLMTALQISQRTLPAEVARAQAGVKSARDSLADAEKNYQRYEELFRQGVVTEKERDTLKLGFDVAKSRLAESESLLRLAEGNLGRIEAAKDDITTAGAQIDVARAALDQAAIQLGYAELISPQDGVVVSRNIEPGETVNIGREVITVSDLQRVDLKIFVDEAAIGRVKPGQKAAVSVDTFPGKIYEGTVSFVSPEGEFTPKIIQTQKERVKLVYLVKISIANPLYELKAGMPADARLHP
ncbi:MAG: HlyD family efflux transporter periplasmic adaptor subunit [Deltaproteobacteria bacterium]|nr:HlyD family efflux transporter periplasmic adaptor subunit [Deltaproteobacteria bacterium]